MLTIGHKKIIYRAMRAGMEVVRAYQTGRVRFSSPAKVKDYDKTLVTKADKESGKAMMPCLLELPKDLYEIHPEDTRGRKNKNARYIVWMDNVDGTRTINNGILTSTIILAVYDKVLMKVIFCMIGIPISREILHATLSKTETKRTVILDENSSLTGRKRVKVKDAPIGNQSTILTDAFEENFPLTLDQFHLLHSLLAKLGTNSENPKGGAHVLVPGSNGYNQAVVAKGWEGMVGGITTAIGGPWDVAGVLLVILAGGFARAFRIEEDGTLVEVDPLNPLAYKLVVYGNTKANVERMVGALVQAKAA